MATIELPCYEMVLTFPIDADGRPTAIGEITSNLHDHKCPFCGKDPCPENGHCDESQDANTDLIMDEIEQQRYNFAIDAIEAMVLAHNMAGINVADPAYIEGIETAVDAVNNNL